MKSTKCKNKCDNNISNNHDKWDRCQIVIDMIELWDIHVSLTREVIFAAALKSPNFNSSLNALLNNQRDLGANLAKYYDEKVGNKYAILLTEHINIAVEIVSAVLSGLDPKNLIAKWYKNADKIAKFLDRVIATIRFNKAKKLLDAHLECTLTEATLIIEAKYTESTLEYQICLNRTRRLATYIANNVWKSKDQ